MAEIHVTFPASGKPYVHNPVHAVKPKECVHWHIYSWNPDVNFVRIAFEKQAAHFFEDDSGRPTNEIQRPLHETLEDPAHGKTKIKETVIWGEAPASESRIEDKYTIYAYRDKAGQQEVPGTMLDPQIVTDGP